MIKKLFSIDYHPKLIKIMIEFTFLGVLVANIVAPLIAIFLVYEFLPSTFIYIWFFLNIIIFISRIIVRNKLSYFLKNDDNEGVKRYIVILLFLVLITSLLSVSLVWVSFFYEAPSLHLLLIGVMILTISAGAISTLGSVFTAFFLYVSASATPLFILSIYIGGEIFSVFSIIVLIFSVIILKAGYSQFTVLKNSVTLEETFKTIFDKSSDGIMIIKNGRFIDCNEAVIKIIGCKTKDDFLKLSLTDLSPQYQPDGALSLQKAQELMMVAFETGFNSFEWLHKRYNGELFWAELVLTKIGLNDETLLHVVFRDISVRKKQDDLLKELNANLEEKIKQAVDEVRKKEKLLQGQHRLAQMGEMISMIAHQWRQPLAAIANTSNGIKLKIRLGKLDDDTTIKLADNITNYTQHLSETIDDFRNFFKPDKKKQKVSYTEILGSILGIIKGSIEDKGISLIQELNCDDRFYTYENELKQVILNLIKNAEEIMIENNIKDPYIKILTYKENDNYIFEVSDNGGGIPKKIIDNIFDPYFSTKNKKNGTGLGLYMSKEIVENHCLGKLSVENSDDGAVFKICLRGI